MKKKILIGMVIAPLLILSALFFILKNTPEHHIHNMRGANNRVYLHKDGHQEAVFDHNGNAVTDCINMASYNYANPKTSPFMHLFKDTAPWLIWGNCRADPTSPSERFAAYMKDLHIGFRRSVGL